MTTNDKRPLKVFLCHAHADRDVVRGLYTRLKREGVDVWLDKEKLLPGSDWEYEIRKAVREADVVVVCLSKQFNQAGFRQKEVRIALDAAMEKPEGEIFIIPARLEESDNLESLNRWHWVDLFESDGFQRLILALRVRADKIGATLRLRKSGQTTISRSDNNNLGTLRRGAQETAEDVARKRADKETVERARLEAEARDRQKTARQDLERVAVQMVAFEKEEQEITPKVQLETGEQTKKEVVEEKMESNLIEEKNVEEPEPKNDFYTALAAVGAVLVIVIILFLISS